MNLDRELWRFVHSQAKKDTRQLPRPHSVREPSASEKAAIYQPPGTGILFCTHAKSYFEPCSTCKRTKRMADDERKRFIAKYA